VLYWMIKALLVSVIVAFALVYTQQISAFAALLYSMVCVFINFLSVVRLNACFNQRIDDSFWRNYGPGSALMLKHIRLDVALSILGLAGLAWWGEQQFWTFEMWVYGISASVSAIIAFWVSGRNYV